MLLGSNADDPQVILAGLAFLTFRTSSDVHHVLVIDSGSTGTRMCVTAICKAIKATPSNADNIIAELAAWLDAE